MATTVNAGADRVIAAGPVVDLVGPGNALPDAGLLQRVGLALNSTLELPEVLGLLAEIALEFSGSDSCGIFLLDGMELRPTVGLGTQTDEARWQRFLAMEPIPLDPERWHLLRSGRAIAFEDARESSFVPEPWVDEFHVRALVLVPLLAAGEPCGLMAVDWREARRFHADELRLLEAIASHAGVAVRNATLFGVVRRRAQLQAALVRAAAQFGSPLEPGQIGDRLVKAFSDLFGARLCAVGLLDDARTTVTVIASLGVRPLAGPLPLAAVPMRLTTRAWTDWARQKSALDLGEDDWIANVLGGRDAGAAWYLMLPLSVAGHSRGVVLLGFDAATRLDVDERQAAEALADIAAAALERHDLVSRLGRQLRQLDALHQVSAALTEGADAGRLVDDLNRLLSGHGIEVVGLSFRDRRLARHLGGAEPTPEERAAWRAGGLSALLPDGTLSLPLRVGRRLVGMLRVRPSGLTEEQRQFLDALGRGLAEVAYRGALRTAVEEAARDRAVALDRERMADDLHDTAGQVFVAIGLLARRQAGRFEPGSPEAAAVTRLAELADGGKWEIQQAVQALAFVPASRRGLVPSIEALSRSVEADSGIAIEVEVVGQTVRLAPRTERALYRVFHQAVTNSWRHAHCRSIRVVLEFGPGETRLTVTDDGIGLADDLVNDGHRVGIAGMQRAATDVGGEVTIANGAESGVVVEARVPTEVK